MHPASQTAGADGGTPTFIPLDSGSTSFLPATPLVHGHLPSAERLTRAYLYPQKKQVSMRLPHRVPWAHVSELEQVYAWIYADENDIDAKVLAVNRVRM